MKLPFHSKIVESLISYDTKVKVKYSNNIFNVIV